MVVYVLINKNHTLENPHSVIYAQRDSPGCKLYQPYSLQAKSLLLIVGLILVHMRKHEPDHLPLVDVQMRLTRNTHRSLETASTMTPGPIAETRLHDCNLFKTVLLVIYITYLYRRKFPLFIPVSRDIVSPHKTIRG